MSENWHHIFIVYLNVALIMCFNVNLINKYHSKKRQVCWCIPKVKHFKLSSGHLTFIYGCYFAWIPANHVEPIFDLIALQTSTFHPLFKTLALLPHILIYPQILSKNQRARTCACTSKTLKCPKKLGNQNSLILITNGADTEKNSNCTTPWSVSELDRVCSPLERPSLTQAHCKSMLEQKGFVWFDWVFNWVIENSWVELWTLPHKFFWMLLTVYCYFVFQSLLMLQGKINVAREEIPPRLLSPGFSWCFPEGINNHLQGTLITKRATYVTLSRAPESAYLLTNVRCVFWQPQHADECCATVA